ncbi:pyridoxal phosphate-dependent transferase [Syncephalis fuscata]|nr:pyridoxal phosphate-dependent transferase [Syncephalis fuscata]
MNLSKKTFLNTAASSYGYSNTIDHIREREFARLKDTVYLDHTGTTLYPASTINAFSENLTNHIYGNPHSRHPSSELTARIVDQTRLRVLSMCKADPSQYSVIFTTNATAALKLCWEMCPLEAEDHSEFYYLCESHTSVVGLRALSELMKIKAQSIEASSVESLLSSEPSICANDAENSKESYSLFVYPAQCNYSGERFPWKWSALARNYNKQQQCRHRRQWLVAVDASAYASTSPINLSDANTAPDFIILSFYKIFGFPTGLGALIVRKSLMPLLRKSYFGGGTASAVTVDTPWQVFRDTLHTRYEDGTVNFLDIIGLGIAMDKHKELYTSMQAVSEHTHALFVWLYKQMQQLVHANGQPVCQLYVEPDNACNPKQQGPVLTFNLIRSDGSPVGYAEVERIASVSRIHLRTGGFCNPGAAQKWLRLTDTDIRSHLKAGHVCWDDQDIIDGQLTGAIRLSLGAMSNYEDMAAWIEFLEKYYVEDTNTLTRPPFFTTFIPKSHGPTDITASTPAYLSHLTIFPIKSCQGYSIPSGIDWPVTEEVSKETQRALTQKQYPKMTTIQPRISQDLQELVISAPDMDELRLSLNELKKSSELTTVRVCGENVSACSFNDRVDLWFSTVLGLPCQLAGKVTTRSCQLPTVANEKTKTKMGLTNESPFLLVSQSSVNYIMDQIASSIDGPSPFENENDYEKASRFRGNFLIEGSPVFAEDHWHQIKIGSLVFEIIGPCRRCHMVCIEQKTARKSSEPYATLAEYRRLQGKILFGQHLRCISNLSPTSCLRLGDKIAILS